MSETRTATGVVGTGAGPGSMSATALVLAHQGGWDEALLIGGPIVVIIGLLMLAKRRVDAAHEAADGATTDHDADHTPGHVTDHTADHTADHTVDHSGERGAPDG